MSFSVCIMWQPCGGDQATAAAICTTTKATPSGRGVSITRALDQVCRRPRKTLSGGGAGSCGHVGKVTAGKYSARTTHQHSWMFVLLWLAWPSSADLVELISSFILSLRQLTVYFIIVIFIFISSTSKLLSLPLTQAPADEFRLNLNKFYLN